MTDPTKLAKALGLKLINAETKKLLDGYPPMVHQSPVPVLWIDPDKGFIARGPESLSAWLASPEGEKAVRDKVHGAIGGSGYDIVIGVREFGRTDYLLQSVNQPPVYVERVCRRNRDNLEVAHDMPAFYAAALIWLAERGD